MLSQARGDHVHSRFASMLLVSLLLVLCCGAAITILYALCVRRILCVDNGLSLLVVYACLLPAVVVASRVSMGLGLRCCVYSYLLGTLAWILRPTVALGSRQESLSFAIGSSVVVVAMFLFGGILGVIFWPATNEKASPEDKANL